MRGSSVASAKGQPPSRAVPQSRWTKRSNWPPQARVQGPNVDWVDDLLLQTEASSQGTPPSPSGNTGPAQQPEF